MTGQGKYVSVEAWKHYIKPDEVIVIDIIRAKGAKQLIVAFYGLYSKSYSFMKKDGGLDNTFR